MKWLKLINEVTVAQSQVNRGQNGARPLLQGARPQTKRKRLPFAKAMDVV